VVFSYFYYFVLPADGRKAGIEWPRFDLSKNIFYHQGYARDDYFDRLVKM